MRSVFHAFTALSIAIHPLHTTLTELSEDRPHATVRATIRVFADDFGTALTRFARRPVAPAGPARDSVATGYVSSVFSFVDRSGRALPLHACGTRQTEGLLWICVEASSTEGLAPLNVRNTILAELFDDQVNVVQGTVAGTRKSLLFTRGDKAKPLT